MAFSNPVKSQSLFTYEGSSVPSNPSQGQLWRERNAVTGLIVADWERVDNEWLTVNFHQESRVYGNYRSINNEIVSNPSLPGSKTLIEAIKVEYGVVVDHDPANYNWFFVEILDDITLGGSSDLYNVKTENWIGSAVFQEFFLGTDFIVDNNKFLYLIFKFFENGNPSDIEVVFNFKFRGVR